jgi:hypothetical protein
MDEHQYRNLLNMQVCFSHFRGFCSLKRAQDPNMIANERATYREKIESVNNSVSASKTSAFFWISFFSFRQAYEQVLLSKPGNAYRPTHLTDPTPAALSITATSRLAF